MQLEGSLPSAHMSQGDGGQSCAVLCHALDALNVQASWLSAWQAYSAEDVDSLKVGSIRC